MKDKTFISEIKRRFKKRTDLLKYYWYHKRVFKITNTKFDISYCVFKESFLNDQYNIRHFLNEVKSAEKLFFMDIGRNHGFVFFYTMYHIMKSGFKVSEINYFGIDPSPLKFVYFNYFDFLKNNDITINYNIIDRAIVRNEEEFVRLKYGEDNFGNFNVNGSNFEKKLSDLQTKRSFIELNVQAISIAEVKKIIKENLTDATIIKIDCKFETSKMFKEFRELLHNENRPLLISAEKDDDIEGNEPFDFKDQNVLSYSNLHK